jgi:hypothetical protein
MHGSLDKSGKDENRIQIGKIGFLALPLLLTLMLVGLAIVQPKASIWISQAAQAEFVGIELLREVVPTQLAQPSMQIRTVRAD